MEGLIFLYFLATVISLLVIILVIRFLWMVPNELRDIKNALRYTVYSLGEDDDDGNDDDDVADIDPNKIRNIQKRVEKEFENSSTLR